MRIGTKWSYFCYNWSEIRCQVSGFKSDFPALSQGPERLRCWAGWVLCTTHTAQCLCYKAKAQQNTGQANFETMLLDKNIFFFMWTAYSDLVNLWRMKYNLHYLAVWVLACLDPHSVRFVLVYVWLICALLWQLYESHHNKLEFASVDTNADFNDFKRASKMPTKTFFRKTDRQRVGFGTKLVQAHCSYPGDVSV